MDFIYSAAAMWQSQREKDLKENFKAISDWDRLESKGTIRKIYKIEKNLTSLFFQPFSNSFSIKQNPAPPLEFVITRIHCTKDIFSR